MAETDRQARNHHIHRNAGLGPRRSVAMTFGISRFGAFYGRRNSPDSSVLNLTHAGKPRSKMSCFVTTHPMSDIDKLRRAISLLARVADKIAHLRKFNGYSKGTVAWRAKVVFHRMTRPSVCKHSPAGITKAALYRLAPSWI